MQESNERFLHKNTCNSLSPYVGIIQIRFRVKASAYSQPAHASTPFSFLTAFAALFFHFPHHFCDKLLFSTTIILLYTPTVEMQGFFMIWHHIRRSSARNACADISLWSPVRRGCAAPICWHRAPFWLLPQARAGSAPGGRWHPYVWLWQFRTVLTSFSSMLSSPSIKTVSSNPKSPIRRR